MKSLFLKIFVSYWMAQALFFMLAILVAYAMRPSREIAYLQAQEARFLNDAIQANQSGGEQGVWKYLRGVHDSYHVRLFVIDEQGHDILGRKPPEWLERAQRGHLSTADSFWGKFHPVQFLRAAMTGPDGHPYTLFIELPPEPHGPFAIHGIPGLGLLIGIISSGLVCYILARYLTSPITRLRAAAQKMASGDLTARAGIPGSRRRDETAELVRDFDLMADRLENLVGAQRQLLRDISHELRSPLARLNVALELARQRSGADAYTALDRIERETSRLNEMIQRLLTLVRLEGGDDSLEKTEVHLQDLIQEIAKDATFEAQNRQCQVEVEASTDYVVKGSPSLLHSAIENVVRNAIRYTEEGTTVRIRLQAEEGAEGSQAVVQVTDSGPGVPQDALDKLFLPFYRIDDARGRQTGGVGLGLAITARAVSLHSGSVRAVNRPEGGLTVEIRLPLASGSQVVPAENPAEVLSMRTGN